MRTLRVRAHKSAKTKEKKVYILIPFSSCLCYNKIVLKETTQ